MKTFFVILAIIFISSTAGAQMFKGVGEDVSNQIVNIDFKKLEVKSNKIITDLCFQNPTGRCVKPTTSFKVAYGSDTQSFTPDKICKPEGYCKVKFESKDKLKTECDVTEPMTVTVGEGKKQIHTTIIWKQRFKCD
jgi:hypothetical protein